MEEIKQPRSGRWMWVLIGIIVIVAVVLWWKGAFGFVNGNSGAFQAVFLTNGQVYFGKLANAKSQYPVLREVYYLQVTQPLQPKDQNAQTAPNLNLIKLGGELHGPMDEMFINRDQIIFYEDMKTDSQVVTAIRQYQESQQTQP